jgi:hypothetical protein
MSENSELNDLTNDLVDQYLLFLRGRGPEPDLSHLTQAHRRAIRARLALVDALADRGPALPAMEDDPVAMRLGVVPDRRSGGGEVDPDGAASAAEVAHGQTPSAALRALDELESYFGGQVVIDWSPTWSRWSRHGLTPVAQCSALGDSMALFITADQNWAEEPGDVASFLRSYPDISSMGLISADATYAAVVTAAACNRSIDPVLGWLEPGSAVASNRLDLTLHRYFEQRLPRWDRVAGLDDLLDLGDISADADAAVGDEVAAAMRAKPRLIHKKHAQQSLAEIDQPALAALIVDIQTRRLTGGEAADRVIGLAEATP